MFLDANLLPVGEQAHLFAVPADIPVGIPTGYSACQKQSSAHWVEGWREGARLDTPQQA